MAVLVVSKVWREILAPVEVAKAAFLASIWSVTVEEEVSAAVTVPVAEMAATFSMSPDMKTSPWTPNLDERPGVVVDTPTTEPESERAPVLRVLVPVHLATRFEEPVPVGEVVEIQAGTPAETESTWPLVPMPRLVNDVPVFA